jgi:hypothetical protein
LVFSVALKSKETKVSDSDFVSKYREALACYSEEDFETIFQLAGIEGQELRNLGKDFLGIAGAFYLTSIEEQSQQAPKTETLKHLARAQRSSRDLAENLSKALQDHSMISALMEASLAARTTYPDEDSQKRDSYKILNSIFPFEVDGSGFRYEGLCHALTALADTIALVEAEAIRKPGRGRSHALRPWILMMCFYWVEVKGDIPTSGHYDAETADYDSPTVASLSHAARCLDPELSSRALVASFAQMTKVFGDTPQLPSMLLNVGFTHIICANASVSGSAAFERFAGMPEGYTVKMQEQIVSSADPTAEKSTISKEEFYETLKSSDEGLMLLRSLMAIQED